MHDFTDKTTEIKSTFMNQQDKFLDAKPPIPNAEQMRRRANE